MGRLLWFAVGVGLTAFIIIKGREYYRRVTPAGVSERLGRTGQDVSEWVTEFLTTATSAMQEREGELRDALGLDEQGAAVQGTSR